MGTISVSLPTDGTTADVADVNTPITTIVNEINGNLDNANIKSGAAISTSKLATDAGITTGMLTDGAVTSAKLAEAFFRGRYQNDTTNSAPTGLTVQFGWGWKLGTATNFMSETVTFPTAFSSAPVVLLSSAGVRSGSDPTAISDLNASSGDIWYASGISTTGFTSNVTQKDSSNLTTTVRYGYSWIAIGTV